SSSSGDSGPGGGAAGAAAIQVGRFCGAIVDARSGALGAPSFVTASARVSSEFGSNRGGSMIVGVITSSTRSSSFFTGVAGAAESFRAGRGTRRGEENSESQESEKLARAVGVTTSRHHAEKFRRRR